jgi:Ala-tRNA(Pro) deacylase
MPVQKLREFLDAKRVKYVTIRHSRAYTSQEIAASAHIRGKDMAKSVVVVMDGQLALAVLPASERVDLERLREESGAKRVELATEQEFKDRFPECEVGAMPPFGNLYGMPVYASRSLADDDEIAFNAGSHSELVQLAFDDFERLAKPNVVRFTTVGD